jgi:O-acetyl-ADP-ribose deacetylase (regulator of RNase III)
VFGTGHAQFKFGDAVRVKAETLRDQATAVRRVFIVIYDVERVDAVMRIIRAVIPGAEVDLQHGPASEEMVSMWGARW